MNLIKSWAITLMGVSCLLQQAFTASFNVSYLDGGSWNTVYAQGFSPSVSANPDPGAAAGDTVYLDSFQFYKSGSADAAADIRLAILNNLFADLTGLSTSHGAFVGLSANIVPGTAPLATGDAIEFDMADLPLTYGGNYAAVFVNVGPGGALTPVRVSALTANYTEAPPGSGSFHPETNYGTENDFQFSTSNFIATNQFGQFFSNFSFAGDANFSAAFNTIPEPGTMSLGLATVMVALITGRRMHRS